MRKGVDGLAAIVNLSLACDFSGESMFIFCNKSASEAVCTQTAMRDMADSVQKFAAVAAGPM